MERALERYNPSEKYIPQPLSPEVAEQIRKLSEPPSPEVIARRMKEVEKVNQLNEEERSPYWTLTLRSW